MAREAAAAVAKAPWESGEVAVAAWGAKQRQRSMLRCSGNAQLWVQLACPQILSHSCLGCALVWAPRPWHSAFSFGARIATEVAQLMQHCCAHTWIRAELTERSEKLAEEGDVDASMAAVAQAERLRK